MVSGVPDARKPDCSIDVGVLFAEHGAKVLAFTHRMLGNRADAEDATQETFLKAHRQASTFDGRCAPSTWLFAIARNTCLDRLGGGPRSFESLEAALARGLAVGRGAPTREPDAEAERRDHVEAVREGCLLATLGCLTFDQRVAFVLRVLCEVSTSETAVVLDRTENAVRVLTHRARRNLKGFLCRNCSVYDPDNECSCENLVEFSLSQGWIGPDDRRVSRHEAAVAATRAAAAVDEVARLGAVFRSLDVPMLTPDAMERIRDRIQLLRAPAEVRPGAGTDAPAGGPAK